MTNPLKNPVAAAGLLAAALTFSARAAVATVPPVLLSAQHKQMCRVGVGDALPALKLTNDKAAPLALPELYGTRATVVAFVGYDHWMNPALLQDLPGDVVARYAERGVATVVVKVVDSPATLPQGSPLTTLSDPTGGEFAKVGSGRMPRVYVLDAAGKIVWFDIEYSRSTRRELKETLTELAAKKQAP